MILYVYQVILISGCRGNAAERLCAACMLALPGEAAARERKLTPDMTDSMINRFSAKNYRNLGDEV